jgi:3D (Asp-Asp-Asp) domain-containing protein
MKPVCHYDVKVTFYGYDDNDDGSDHFGTAAISYPHDHQIATEDIGSWKRPSTFACDPKFIKPGTIIYVPRLQKYYIMEDECVDCMNDWTRDRTKHVDLYIGGNKRLGGQALLNRESELTVGGPEIVIVNPPKNLPLDPMLLFKENL